MQTTQESMISIQVVDMNNNTHDLQVNRATTGYGIKTLVYQQLSQSLTQHEMKLVYAGTEIQNNQRLSQFNIVLGSIITFEQQKIDLNQVSKIVAINEEDPITGENIITKMPCGHSIGRDSMVTLIRSLISQNMFEIRCPFKDENGVACLMEWDFKTCKKIGVFTKEENEAFQSGLSLNWIKSFGKDCPKCKNYVSKGSLQINRVKCPSCKHGDFCYMCLQLWKGKDNDFCGSQTCKFLDETIGNSPWNRLFRLKDPKKNNEVIEVKTPKYRRCPHCKIPVENYEKCKHTKCAGCLKSFCWVCLSILKTTWECGGYGDYCGKVAQVQTYKMIV